MTLNKPSIASLLLAKGGKENLLPINSTTMTATMQRINPVKSIASIFLFIFLLSQEMNQIKFQLLYKRV